MHIEREELTELIQTITNQVFSERREYWINTEYLQLLDANKKLHDRIKQLEEEKKLAEETAKKQREAGQDFFQEAIKDLRLSPVKSTYQQSYGGHCGKCGAPYMVPAVWFGVTTPTPIPSCNCWNNGTKTTGGVTE